MMTDPIADMLTRIRNASMARHEKTDMGYSVLKEQVAKVLKAEGFVDDVRVESSDTGVKTLSLVLRYGKDKSSAIIGLKRVSTPGRRVYVRHDRIPLVKSGTGVSILSTSNGVMTDISAREKRVGGELLCEVW